MMTLRGFAVAVGLALAIAFGGPLLLSHITVSGTSETLTLFFDNAAANDLNFGDADSNASAGNGGDGGLSMIRDVANVSPDSSSSVTNTIISGDAIGPNVSVNESTGTNMAGSFIDTGGDVFAPGGNAQGGATGGNNLIADSSGGDGGDATARTNQRTGISDSLFCDGGMNVGNGGAPNAAGGAGNIGGNAGDANGGAGGGVTGGNGGVGGGAADAAGGTGTGGTGGTGTGGTGTGGAGGVGTGGAGGTNTGGPGGAGGTNTAGTGGNGGSSTGGDATDGTGGAGIADGSGGDSSVCNN